MNKSCVIYFIYRTTI